MKKLLCSGLLPWLWLACSHASVTTADGGRPDAGAGSDAGPDAGSVPSGDGGPDAGGATADDGGRDAGPVAASDGGDGGNSAGADGGPDDAGEDAGLSGDGGVPLGGELDAGADGGCAAIFAQPVLLQTGQGLAGLIATGDLNGDGLPDLAVVTSGNYSAFPATYQIITYLNDGDRGFVAGVVETLPQPNCNFGQLWLGDLDGRGRAGAVESCGTGLEGLFVFQSDGDGGLAQPAWVQTTDYVSTLVVSDLDGDGRADLVTAGSWFGFDVLLQLPDGGFSQPVVYDAFATDLAVADFNGDGLPDIAAVGFDTLHIFLNQGDGGFNPQPPLNAVPSLSNETPALAAGDLNGDGIVDVAISAIGPTYLQILLGQGDGGFEFSPAIETADAGLTWLTISALVDGGPPAVLGAEPFAVFPNGDGGVGPPQFLGAVQGQPGFALADFNGDGRLDLATVIGNDVAIYYGTGCPPGQ
ncbi:MAG: FG-GAP repeat domain-containing protein [Myxococcales bacterium]